jgi:hypothetical protein
MCQSIALVSSSFVVRHFWLRVRGANMMRVRVLGAASFSLIFLLSVFAPAHARAATTGARNETPSPLSAIAHDFATWLDHVARNGANNHRAGRPLIPLPRPRPAAGLASHPVASNKEWSEYVPTPGALKKTTRSTLVQIND